MRDEKGDKEGDREKRERGNADKWSPPPRGARVSKAALQNCRMDGRSNVNSFDS